MRHILKFTLAASCVFAITAIATDALAKSPLEAVMDRFAYDHGFDICAPLDIVKKVIDMPYIKINFFDGTGVYPYSYVEDLISGDQFYIQFFTTTMGDMACLEQVWSGMFRDPVIGGLKLDASGHSI